MWKFFAMLELTYQGLITAVRSQGLRALLGMAIVVLGAALLAGSFSGRQPVTVALDVGITGIKTIMLLMALFWIQDLFTRDIERKTLYFVLAYPITRSQYLFARFASAALLALMATFMIGALLWLTVEILGSDYKQPTPPAPDVRFLFVLLGIWLDILVITAFACLIATLSTTPFLPLLLSLGFALAARGLGPAFDYLRESPFADPAQAALLGPLLEYSYFWLPDLSRLDWRDWVLYDLPVESLHPFTAGLMAAAYVVLALSIASWIFERRNIT